MRELNRIASTIPSSPTVAVSDKAKRLKAAGEDIIDLTAGEPDFDTPAHVVDAAVEALRSGKTRYAVPSKGINPLLEAIANKMQRDNDVKVNPASDIIVTPGGKWALYLTLQALLNPGDEVLILEPAWVSYPSMVMMLGGTPVDVPLDAADNFTITAEVLRRYVTERTKVIIVNSPNNPTGRVLTSAEAEAIADVALESDLYVVSDEIYEKIIFDGRKHISIASLPDMGERTITINGMSKGFAMTGWRLGWLAGPTPVLAIAAKFNSQSITSAATFTMHATTTALNGSMEVVGEMCRAFWQRRDFIVKAFNEIDGVVCSPIEGAFYAFPAFLNSKRNSIEIAEILLDEAKVAGVPGSAFSDTGEKHIRFSFATSMTQLEAAVERIASVAHKL
jgi:aspartate aminotransferase